MGVMFFVCVFYFPGLDSGIYSNLDNMKVKLLMILKVVELT